MMLDGFYELSAHNVPAAIGIRVLDQLQPRRSAVWRSTVAAAALCTAAALLITMVPLQHWTVPNAATPKQSPVQVAALEPPLRTYSLEQVPIVSKVLTITRTNDEDPYAAIAGWTGHALGSAFVRVPGMGGNRAIQDSAADAASDDATWTMSEGFKPVTETVAATFYLLLRSLPGTELASRS